MIADNICDKPVFICGHRRSGTTMFLCLLDNHPELLVHPADTGFFYAVFPDCEDQPKNVVEQKVVERCLRDCLSNEMAHVDRPNMFDLDAMAQTYSNRMAGLNNTSANHLKMMILAYGEHCGQPNEKWKRWVEKTTSTEIYASEIISWFPEALFIHVLRDPRDNWASLKSGWQARYQYQENDLRSLLQSLFDRGGLGMRMAELNGEGIGRSAYMAIRYEDVVTRWPDIAKEVADFLNIELNDKMYSPTVNGVLWPGNNFDGMVHDAPSAYNITRWAERTEPEEVALIEAHMGYLMEQFGYELTTSPLERTLAANKHYRWLNKETKR